MLKLLSLEMVLFLFLELRTVVSLNHIAQLMRIYSVIIVGLAIKLRYTASRILLLMNYFFS